MGGLGVLGAFAVLASGVPRPGNWLVAVAAMSWGARQAWMEITRQHRLLVWASDGRLSIDGDVVAQPQLRWRGPIAFLHWRDGAGRRAVLSWWPDTMAVPERRELRLAAARAVSAATRPSMAP